MINSKRANTIKSIVRKKKHNRKNQRIDCWEKKK